MIALSILLIDYLIKTKKHRIAVKNYLKCEHQRFTLCNFIFLIAGQSCASLVKQRETERCCLYLDVKLLVVVKLDGS